MGAPYDPLEVCGLEAEPNHQTTLLPNMQPSMGSELVGADSGGASSATSVEVVPGAMDMLTDVWKHQKEQQAKEDKDKAWQQGLLKVGVQIAYLSHPGVPCKGEVVDGKKCKTADWPSELSEDVVQLDDFKEWLTTEKMLNKNWTKYRCRDVGRLLGALECKGNAPWSTQCLVAFGTGDIYKQIFALPLMDPKYSWPLDIIDSTIVYCEYNKDITQGKIKRDDESAPWAQYNSVIIGVESKLRGGIRKACIAQYSKSLRAKYKADEHAIASFPSPKVLHKSV